MDTDPPPSLRYLAGQRTRCTRSKLLSEHGLLSCKSHAASALGTLRGKQSSSPPALPERSAGVSMCVR